MSINQSLDTSSDDSDLSGLKSWGDGALMVLPCDLELLRTVEAQLGPKHPDLHALAEVLGACVVKSRQFAKKRRDDESETRQLHLVLAHLMESRQQIEARVDELERQVLPALKDEIKEQAELGENINEECALIQGELERLTQVLFEEVNAMVSTEARAKHEELQTTQELEKEIQRVKDSFQAFHRRFMVLKSKLSSSGSRLVKQKSMAWLESGRSSGRLLRHQGSERAIDEIMRNSPQLNRK